MKSQYYSIYNNFDLVQKNLQQKIQKLLPNIDITNEKFSYEQLLLILDQRCQQIIHNHFKNNNEKIQDSRVFRKANRNVTRQIFNECQSNSKTTLKAFIAKYIQLLQTSKLCLIRQQSKQQILQKRIQQAKKNTRKSNYVHIKLIQATIHSHYSNSPCFQYKIQPSNIPLITIVNSLNPTLNHQYTLKLDSNTFFIYFYESGIQIYKWKFNLEQNDQNDGEYFKSVSAQSITFQIKIKILPQNSSEQLTNIKKQLQTLSDKIQVSNKAFYQLCHYLPFLQSEKIVIETDNYLSFAQRFINNLFLCLPFMKNHVRNLNYITIAFIFVQCLASISWAVQFIDIIIGFSILGLLYDRSKLNFNLYFWSILFILILSIIKTIWGALLTPFGVPKYPILLVVSLLFKILVQFFLWITIVKSSQIPEQRLVSLYNYQQKDSEFELQEDISIFKANSNYYKNKNELTQNSKNEKN